MTNILPKFIDILLFIGAVLYGYLRNGELNYKVFKGDQLFLNVFRLMLAGTLLLYCGIAWIGIKENEFLIIYCIYITSLLAWEDHVYRNKIQYLIQFTDLLAIEVIRESILIAGGFWK